MSTLRSCRALFAGAGLVALTLAAATPAVAQYRDPYRPPAPAYGDYGSYGQAYGRADTRVVVTYGQPTHYDYGYSYGRAGVGAGVYGGQAGVDAATVVAAMRRDPYGYGYGYGYGHERESYYQPPRPHDGYAYRYRQRHDKEQKTKEE